MSYPIDGTAEISSLLCSVLIDVFEGIFAKSCRKYTLLVLRRKYRRSIV